MNATAELLAETAARPMPPRREMEHAFLSSDRSYDGVFYTAVKSTGIFCRPSCPARKPLPQNVEFFGTVKTALFAGYRPCKRCHPLANNASDCIPQLLAAVENSPTGRVSAAELRAVGIDPARARRQFLKSLGLTFQAYCRGHRLSRALKVIRTGGSVDDAVFASGYESHSGFRDHFHKTFGHPPGQAASLECVHLAWITTPVGPMVSAATDEGICLFEFTDRRMLEPSSSSCADASSARSFPANTRIMRNCAANSLNILPESARSSTSPLCAWAARLRCRCGANY